MRRAAVKVLRIRQRELTTVGSRSNLVDHGLLGSWRSGGGGRDDVWRVQSGALVKDSFKVQRDGFACEVPSFNVITEEMTVLQNIRAKGAYKSVCMLVYSVMLECPLLSETGMTDVALVYWHIDLYGVARV